MSTPFDIFGVIAATGQKLVAALRFPIGLQTSFGTTVTGGTVIGAGAVPDESATIYVGLIEGPMEIYGAAATIGGTTLPSSSDRPYTVEARVVDDATDMEDYAAIGAAFEASDDVAYGPDIPATIQDGMLKSGKWGQGATLDSLQDAIEEISGSLPTDTGMGNTPIDHDGADGVTVNGNASAPGIMQFTVGGVGIDELEIAAYLASDYAAGNKSGAYRKGTTYTGSDGKWIAPLMLDADEYTLVVSKGKFLVATIDLVVT